MVSPILTCLCIVLNVLFVSGETGCPDAEDIVPCTCTRRPTVRLTCAGLPNSEALHEIFSNSERYTYHQVHLINSSFVTIPSHIFEKVTVDELYLRNVALQGLFSELAVENHDLYKLEIEDTVVMRTIAAQNFSQFTNLREISVYSSPFPTLLKSFGESLPKNIKKIGIYGSKIKSLSIGALNHVPNLDKFVVESGNLKKLSREVFPRPFYVRILNFNDNKITAIPEDLFTDMPNLQFLSMMNNAISQIPETAFAGRTLNIPYFQFEGNPLQCDCQLLWIIKDKPEVLGGTCSGPEKLNGRRLHDLIPAEIRCSY